MLGSFESQLTELRTKRAAQEKKVADLSKPMRELEALRQQEAEAERVYQSRLAELEQLRVERDDAANEAARVSSTTAELKTAIAVLEEYERGYGARTNAFARALYELRMAEELRVSAAERRDRADARIKELEA